MAERERRLSALRKELQSCIDRLHAIEARREPAHESLDLERIAVDIGRLSTELLRFVAQKIPTSLTD